MIYKLLKHPISQQPSAVMRFNEDWTVSSFIFDLDNTDYQAFKLAVLNQESGGIVENGDSFSLNTDESILEDADGVKMTIDQAKDYVRTLP